MTITEVNGIKYVKKEKRRGKMSSKTLAMLSMGIMLGGDIFGYGKEPERPKVDIVNEYGLIQLKKYNL